MKKGPAGPLFISIEIRTGKPDPELRCYQCCASVTSELVVVQQVDFVVNIVDMFLLK